MKKYAIALVLLLCGFTAPFSLTVTGSLVSADGTSSTAPNGPALVTKDGTWTWDGPKAGSPDTNIFLNGAQSGGGGAAVFMIVDNGGQLYAQIAASEGGGWFVWNAAGGFFNVASPPNATINSVSMSCGTQCTFTAGSAGSVGTVQANLSAGTFAGKWTLPTSGLDRSGAACNNYGTLFSVDQLSGLVSNTSAGLLQSYPGVCLTATQSGLVNSPWTQAFTFTGGTGVTPNIGPVFGGSVPAPAQMAGLIKLVANYDFTNNGNWICNNCGSNTGSTYNFSQINGGTGVSNWLDCTTFGTGTGLWHIGIQGFPSWGACGNISMGTDSSIGKQVFQLNYPSGTNSIESIATIGSEGSGGVELGLPYTYYIETTYRMAQLCSGCSANQGGPNGLFVWSDFHSGSPNPSGGNLEDDIGELYVDQGGFGDKGWINWINGDGCTTGCVFLPSGSNYPGGWGPTAYHTYGTLVTENAAGNDLRWCTYVDGVLTSGQCYAFPGPANFNTWNYEPNTLILQTQGNNNPQNYQLFTQYIRVYSCPNYTNPPTPYDPVSRCYGQATTSTGPQGETFFPQPVFFVSATTNSPPGNDTNAGTIAAPFATVQKCQTAMRAQPSNGIKTCYIRAGTYTGGGNGYTTQTIGSAFTTTASLILNGSQDNGTTYQYYPNDGYNTAIFDGGAGTWVTKGNAPGCPQNAITAVGRGVYINSASNVTIDGLTFRNYCHGGVAIHADSVEWAAYCTPGTGANATGDIIRNNIIFNISDATSQCNGDATFNRAIQILGNAQNMTVSHNYLYNLTGGGIAAVTATSNGNFSNLVIDHNLVVNSNTFYSDNGSIYVQDAGAPCASLPTGCAVQGISTNVKIQFNYVLGYGSNGNDGGCADAPTANNWCTNAYYDDDGSSNVTRTGNVAVGLGGLCFYQHGGQNNVSNGNICDVGDQSADLSALPGPPTVNSIGWKWEVSCCTVSGATTHQHDVLIARTASCWVLPSVDGGCWAAMQEDDPGVTYTLGLNGYANYGGSTTILTNSATARGDSSPNAVDPFGNVTSRCPSSNGFPTVDSWGYFIPVGNGVFSAPVTFPAQPSGWATPGFWGPPVGPNWNGKIPHSLSGGSGFTAMTPSYGPTC